MRERTKEYEEAQACSRRDWPRPKTASRLVVSLNAVWERKLGTQGIDRGGTGAETQMSFSLHPRDSSPNGFGERDCSEGFMYSASGDLHELSNR